MTDEIKKWIGLAVGIFAMAYLDSLWKSHAATTAGIPERRTLYDFLQTNPRAFYALWFGAGAIYVFVHYLHD